MKKLLCIFLAIIMIMSCVAMTSCSDDGDETDGGGTRKITDLAGTEVEIPQNVNKVIVTWASGHELVVMLGGAKRLQYCLEELKSNKFEWLQVIEPEIMNVPTLERANLNVEWYMAQSPELIISSKDTEVAQLREAGLTAVFMPMNNIENLQKSITLLGEILGGASKDKAQKYNEYFDKSFSDVNAVISKMAQTELKSTYLLDAQNSSHAERTHGRDTVYIEFLEKGGALSVFPDLKGVYKDVTTEALLLANPEYILIGGMNQKNAYDSLMAREELSTLSAIKNGKVIRIPQGAYQFDRTSAELAMYPTFVAKTLYPEKFASVDLDSMVKSFYKEFFDFTLTDAQASAILAGDPPPKA